MGSKLLKVCAAVMLIVNVGNVDAGKCGYGLSSFSVDVTAAVKAYVSVEVPTGEKTQLKLFKEDGTKTDASERTINFDIKNIAAKSKIVISPGNDKTVCIEGKWYVFHEKVTGTTSADGENKNMNIPLTLKLTKPSGAVAQLEEGAKYQIADEDVKKQGGWSLLVVPSELTDETETGNYSGALKIEVSAE